MAITVNNILTQVGGGAATSVTFSSYNVGAGTAGARKLEVSIQIESDDRTVTGVTYGGVALTLADSVSLGAGAGYNYGSVWYIDDADIGAGSQTEDIVITLSGSTTKVTCIARWLDDVAQGAPTQTVTASDISAGLTSFDATINGVAALAIVTNSAGLGDNVTMTQDGGQTLMAQLAEGTMQGGAAYEIPGAGNHTQGWTFPSARRPNIILVEYGEFGGVSGSITAPTVQPIHAIGTDGNSFATFTGSYSGITPTLIEYRVLASAVEMITWASVDSFGGGTFDATPSIPADADVTIEVRTTVSAVLYSDTSDSFDVGPVLAIIGSSSAVRMFSVGSATLDTISHVKASDVWTEYDSTTETGSPWVELANYLSDKFSAPTGFYDYGAGGTQLTTDWAPPSGASYTNFTGDVEDGNISAIIEVAGSNDTRNGITLVLSDFTDLYTALRSDVRDCPIFHVGNQRFPGAGVDAEAVAAWIVEQSLADDDVDNYQVWRIDTEISGDNVHNTVTGYEEVYLRAGSCFDNAFGSGTYNKGPSITAAVLNTSTEIALTLDDTDTDYTTITPTTGLAGFRVDGGSVSITNAAVVGSEIILTLGSAAGAGDLVEFAAYNEDVPGTLAFTNYPLVNSENTMPVDPITTALVVIQEVTGALAVTLEDDSLAASGTVTQNITGSLAVTLEDDTLSASGVVSQNVTGSLNVTLEDDSLSASGVVAVNVSGSLAVTLVDDSLDASGVADVGAQVECTLVNRSGTALPGLSLLSWSWFDNVDPSLFIAPTDQGELESTDGTGQIVVDIPNSTLTTGQSGTLVLRSNDGTLLGAYNLTVI
jgi:hypothetical protein